MPSTKTILSRPRDFVVSRSGSIAILGAGLIFVLLACVGFAIDYTRSINARTALQQAVDAAALAAANDPLMKKDNAREIAVAYLNANARGTLKTLDSKALANARLDVEWNNAIIEMTATTHIKSTFANVVGISELPVVATSRASRSIGDTEIYAVIDLSSSLGLAADPQARADLEALTSPYTSGGCAFSCHQRDGWEPAGKTVHDMAREAGIPLREDVLKSAFAGFVDNYLPSEDPAVEAGKKKIGVIGFSDDARMLTQATTDMAKIKASLDLFPGAQRVNTKFDPALTKALDLIGAQGDGFNGHPRKSVLLVTDGLGWNRYGGSDASSNGPIKQSLCDSFKSNGFTLAVIDVKYLDATGEFNFDAYVSGYYNDISPSLQACATPGLYFQATDSNVTALSNAFNDVAKALKKNLVMN